MKTLVVAHGHPDIGPGGGEIAAYDQFTALRDLPSVSAATFLARTGSATVAPGAIALRRPGEYLWRTGIGDWLRLRSAHPESLRTTFRDFLRHHAPDAVFVHHYVHLGIDMLREIRATLPDARIVLCLHEYIAICANHGQMLRTEGRRLCSSETVTDCHACLPEWSPEDFWRRKHFVQKHFEAVDHFVAPSHFLKARYVDWGIPPEYITVVENGLGALQTVGNRPRPSDGRLRLAYFGQINEFKGVDVLLQAVRLLHPDLRARIRLEINGSGWERQTRPFQELIDTLRQPLIAEGTLRWAGPYDRGDLAQRMSGVDWVVVPSIWWENSPLVIQEAFFHGVPVIGSGIGGVAEKIRDGIDGLHFEAKNPHALADVLRRIVGDPKLRDTLAANIRRPPTNVESAAKYLKLVS